MYLSNLANRGAAPALLSTLAFNEARLSVISENIANSETPGYRAKRLDPVRFQKALRNALDARGSDPNKPFTIDAGRGLRTDENGYLQVQATDDAPENILFHDGTNMSMERQMADLAETRMAHELAASLLSGYFDGVRKAIRGTV